MSRLAPTALSTALVAILAVAAHVEVEVVAAGVLVVQALIAAAPSPTDARGRVIRVPMIAPVMSAAVVATVLTVRPSLLDGARGSRLGDSEVVVVGSIAGILPAVALGTFVVLLLQMRSGPQRRDVSASSGYAVALLTVATLTAGWVSGLQAGGDADVVVVAAAGLVGALLAWAVPVDRVLAAGLALGGGIAAAVVATIVLDGDLAWAFGVVVGASTGVFGVLGQVLGRAWGARRRLTSTGWGLPGALSVALAGPVVHVAGQLTSAF